MSNHSFTQVIRHLPTTVTKPGKAFYNISRVLLINVYNNKSHTFYNYPYTLFDDFVAHFHFIFICLPCR